MRADPARMHKLDPQMLDLVLGYVAERLALDEAPVDGLGDRVAMQGALTDLITEEPHPAAEILDIYIEHLADTVLSADSPRFYRLHPCCPDQGCPVVRHGGFGCVFAGVLVVRSSRCRHGRELRTSGDDRMQPAFRRAPEERLFPVDLRGTSRRLS